MSDRVEYKKIWYEKNKKNILATRKVYYLENHSKIRSDQKIYRETHRKERNLYEKKRKTSDPIYKLRKNIGTAVYKVLTNNKLRLSILDFLPYSIEELKIHLENQFDNKMTWENYGIYWHIDHIYPQSLLPYTSMNEDNFKKCWALDNLRPLNAVENIKKSNKIIGAK